MPVLTVQFRAFLDFTLTNDVAKYIRESDGRARWYVQGDTLTYTDANGVEQNISSDNKETIDWNSPEEHIFTREECDICHENKTDTETIEENGVEETICDDCYKKREGEDGKWETTEQSQEEGEAAHA